MTNPLIEQALELIHRATGRSIAVSRGGWWIHGRVASDTRPGWVEIEMAPEAAPRVVLGVLRGPTRWVLVLGGWKFNIKRRR